MKYILRIIASPIVLMLALMILIVQTLVFSDFAIRYTWMFILTGDLSGKEMYQQNEDEA